MHKPATLWRTLRSYQIYGANTNVGKTIMSTILCNAFQKYHPTEKVSYLKPVSTGPEEEADNQHISRFSPNTETRCLFQFDEAVSPHIAARKEPPLSDSEILEQVQEQLLTRGPGTIILETAGGVHSPTPSGSSQADLYRPLRLPICLVADSKLGGISASISAFESLHIRGYDLDAVLQFQDDKYQNHSYLKEYFSKENIFSMAIPPPPPRGRTQEEDDEKMHEYYKLQVSSDLVEETVSILSQKHTSRIQNLDYMSTKANEKIWYPFTQHSSIAPKDILTIDSACGDFFQAVPSPQPADQPPRNETLVPTFDGSGSWWTQGLGHGNPKLSLAASYAAGRYGHVILAGTVHEPALKIAENLLQGLENPRLKKCFFSDNGSTGIEVAMKMALLASAHRYKWGKGEEVGVIGLKGSYHGDTIGAMDCSEPSTFNERVHWYQGRGYWFDFPQVKMKDGVWVVEPPVGMESEFGEKSTFGNLDDIFDLDKRLESKAEERYRGYIEETLERLVKKDGMTFGALIMEPFHPLIPTDKTTWTGLPVIFDEVFTGLYRLGRFSSASFLQTHPDVSVHAKLLTGGLLPLCTTLASESIFDAFKGEEKRDALLHGHSYTAHPVGCHVANTTLGIMREMDERGEWQAFKDDWQLQSPVNKGSKMEYHKTGNREGVWSHFSKGFVHSVSTLESVESVIALGSVLAISLRDKNAGYSSTAATGLQKRMIENSDNFNIHSRVLGNVFYLMASLTSKRDTLVSLEVALMEELTMLEYE